jgi:ATP-dependent HslUV protease subunit HslV
MRSRCSSASKAKLEKHQGPASRARRSSSRRIGAPIASCAGSRRCSRSPDRSASFIITGTGDVLEPEHGHRRHRLGRPILRRRRRVHCLRTTNLSPAEIVKQSLTIAGEICIYTNQNLVIETLDGLAPRFVPTMTRR